MRRNTRLGLAVLAGLSGLATAVVTFGSGATLALDGTGRYALLAQLAFVGSILLLLGSGALFFMALRLWQQPGDENRWGRWLAGAQVVLTALALFVGISADLRVALYLPLILSLLSNGWLWLAANQAN